MQDLILQSTRVNRIKENITAAQIKKLMKQNRIIQLF